LVHAPPHTLPWSTEDNVMYWCV